MEQDLGEAVKWYRNAAEQGDAKALFNLGSSYQAGRGVPQDYIAAYMWYSIGAGGGHKGAVDYLTHLEKEILSPAQVAEGKRLAREWQEKHQKADEK